MTQTPDDVLVGQVVEDRYRIETQLGAGGMGVVYRARHIKVGREVAIKVLHDHLLSDPTMVERFEREAAIAAKLSHRNLVSVIDVGETATKQKLMVLELARGKNLAELISSQGPFARARVIAMTAQLLDGLEHAHAAGLVHRDLKPENVIVEVDETGVEIPRIVDFGIAMLRGDSNRRLTVAGTVLGTPQYMAPEHAQGQLVDPRSDLFALGVMVYEMLAGRLPFDGTGVDVALANITQDPPAIRRRTGATVDPLLEAFTRRLMARRLQDRFQSARAALDVLELIDQHPDAAREILLPNKTPSDRMRVTALGTQAPVLRKRAETSGRNGSPRLGMVPLKLTPAPRPIPPTAPMTNERPRASTQQNLAALAETVEAIAQPKRKRTHPEHEDKSWHPWKSIGLVAGATLAVATAAALALLL